MGIGLLVLMVVAIIVLVVAVVIDWQRMGTKKPAGVVLYAVRDNKEGVNAGIWLYAQPPIQNPARYSGWDGEYVALVPRYNLEMCLPELDDLKYGDPPRKVLVAAL